MCHSQPGRTGTIFHWSGVIPKDESIGHAGDSSGWYAINDYYLEQKYTIIMLTNFGWVDLDELSKRFERILFDEN
ncbi:hypothetical protein [Emticicia sp. C21]|uniref:hypothetical protein n=1 Tax=Emticicia sp. C21 TaxID=2302915 RepID=UPI000E342CB8|nr:hypothetical protein [Emticicia sp. C21]RFS16462.1 hypothetical protein D0T08_12325 [Emticicia sp. C21]